VLLTGLHQLAAGRGDGLLPELLALLESRARAAQANVTELGARRGDGFVQAGPHPVAAIGGELPDGVIPFRNLPAPSEPAITRKTSHQR